MDLELALRQLAGTLDERLALIDTPHQADTDAPACAKGARSLWAA